MMSRICMRIAYGLPRHRIVAKGGIVEFTLGLAQCRHPEDGDVISLVRDWCARAQEAGVDLLVFPESLMSRYEMERGAFLAASQSVGGPFSQAVEAMAAEFGLWVVYTMNERAEAQDKPPYNTAVLVDSEGSRRAVYRKVHLFDTDFTQESSRMSAGDVLLEPVDTPFGRVGIAVCYDLRFPEVARSAALAGCDLMLYPAAWVDGSGKVIQWRMLLAARAIENQMYVAGLSRCDKGYIGSSCVADPYGNYLAEAGSEEELLICKLDSVALGDARSKMPVLSHRRPRLYRA